MLLLSLLILLGAAVIWTLGYRRARRPIVVPGRKQCVDVWELEHERRRRMGAKGTTHRRQFK